MGKILKKKPAGQNTLARKTVMKVESLQNLAFQKSELHPKELKTNPVF